jgi:serralysin
MRSVFICGAIASAIVCASSPSAQAAFHLWNFTEIFSNEDGTIQFIEMRSPSNGEHRLAGHALISSDNTFNVLTNLPNSQTANKFFIFGTAGFAALPGAVQPDYIIPDGFFDPHGDTLDWAGFDDLTFADGQLPLDGRMSLLDTFATSVNTPTNFAGAVGEIDLTPAPTPGDTNGDGTVDLEDLNNVRNNFGAAGPDVVGDANGDDLVDLEDLNAVRNNFGTGGSAAVPEPASLALGLAGVLGFAAFRFARKR